MMHNELIMEEPQEVALKRSQRERRPAISNRMLKPDFPKKGMEKEKWKERKRKR